MIRVLLADDHPILRQGLAKALSAHPDIVIVGEAGTTDETLALLHERAADVVLLDISMPGPGILETLRRLKQSHPAIRALVLTMHAEDQYAVRTLHAGAAGYFTKDNPPQALAEAVRQVFRGQRWVSPALASRIGRTPAQTTLEAPHERLSNREFEVLRHLTRGMSVKEIAVHLSISSKTVSTYRHRILEKLNLKNNADIVRYAVVHGLGEPSLS